MSRNCAENCGDSAVAVYQHRRRLPCCGRRGRFPWSRLLCGPCFHSCSWTRWSMSLLCRCGGRQNPFCGAEAVPYGPPVHAHRCSSWTKFSTCLSWFNDRCCGPDGTGHRLEVPHSQFIDELIDSLLRRRGRSLLSCLSRRKGFLLQYINKVDVVPRRCGGAGSTGAVVEKTVVLLQLHSLRNSLRSQTESLGSAWGCSLSRW